MSFTIGLALLAGLALWLFLEIFRSLLRTAGESRFQRVTLEKLRVQVQETKLRCKEAEKAETSWNGLREFVVDKKVKQCDDVHAIYLKPHDGRPLPVFKPGQYLTFELDKIPGRTKPLIRCYSLSDIARDYYRVTIKKEKAPPDKPDKPSGLGSTFFNETLKEGDILHVRAPMGDFFLDMTKTNPIVLLAGGVGITPVLCMAQAIVASGSKREAHFFYGARNSGEHIHKQEMEKLAAEHGNIHLHVCYNKPGEADKEGRDYQHKSYVCIEKLKEVLPSNNFEYYLCGGPAFMQSLTKGLSEWGVPESNVHFESFGPATVVKPAPAPSPAEAASLATLKVTFKQTDLTVPWNPAAPSLLSFGQEQNAKIDKGCGDGKCGCCATTIISGEVEYFKKHTFQPNPGTCLTCVCRPKSDLVLDA